MSLFNSKETIKITAKSAQMQSFLMHMQRLVTEYDERVYASEKKKTEMTNAAVRSRNYTEEDQAAAEDSTARAFTLKAAKEMEDFYKRLTEFVKKQREQNHEMM